ncbi:F1F0 ATP synthase subunit 5 [Saccharomycopsis crataegensis]|uniref:ATP synthase subunit 5, mitochondrial n=1 Tax=Saccharomycopsis crataegensis TaxID=43959 RepID=A0AAV5QLQ5_9ASCO|nr:F1F0 ATP synthase subunit 5 [Saccharomycopsis crataegensis]
MASRMFIRSMASAAKSVKPPVQLFGLEGTYASALYSAAAKDSSIEAAGRSLKSVTSLLGADAKVGEIIANPALSFEDRKFVVETLSSKTVGDKSVTNLLNVLAENNRLNLLPSVISQFQVLEDAHNGIVEAVITSSKPLESKYLRKIQSAISGSTFVGEGKTLKLVNKINPEILGGLIVEVGDRTVDLSVSGKITKYNQILSEAI